MKRLDLHPITYGILSLQYTMNGRSASPRYSKRTLTDSTQDGTVCTEYSSREPSREAPELLSPRPLPPPPSRPCLPETKSRLRQYIRIIWSQVFELRLLPPEGWVLFIRFLVYLLFFLVKKKKRNENKHITVLKYCLAYSVSLCSVCCPWTGLSWFCFLFCLGWGQGSPPGSLFNVLASLRHSAHTAPASLLFVFLRRQPGWWSTFKKENSPLPSPPPPQSPSVPVCHSQPIKRRYELVFLL